LIREKIMRKTITLAAAMLSAVALMSGPTQAMTSATPHGVRGAAEALSPIDNVACWRYGVVGWGWYPCAYYVGPRSGYYYSYGGWGWRRWHHHW
jgi:hypothetical protein